MCVSIYYTKYFSHLNINVKEKMVFKLEKELHKPVRQKFRRVKICSPCIDHIWAADLRVLTTYSKENKGYKYISAVIDIFSKYVWCVSLRKKNAEEVSN